MTDRLGLISRRRFLTLAGATACALPTRIAWPASGAARRSLRLVFFTDVHARTEWETPRATQMAAAAINKRRPKLVIAGGDLIAGGFESAAATVAPRWEVYLEMHRAIKARVEPVIGNHDLVAAIPEDGTPPSNDPREPFRRLFGLEQTYRSFELRGYRFLLLDSISVVGGEHNYIGHVDENQLKWLESELRSIPRDTPVVMATHLPLLTSMYQATEGATEGALPSRVVENNREVLELFDKHNLLLVLQGHLHVDEMIRWRNTTFVTGGAVSGRWWGGSLHGTREGFGELTLRPDRVEWQYHTYGWTVRRPQGDSSTAS